MSNLENAMTPFSRFLLLTPGTMHSLYQTKLAEKPFLALKADIYTFVPVVKQNSTKFWGLTSTGHGQGFGEAMASSNYTH